MKSIGNLLTRPTGIITFVICFSLLIVSLSVAYYFVVFLPQNEQVKKNYEAEVKKLRQENADIQSNLEYIQNDMQTSTPEVNQEEIKNSIKDTISEEMQNQANCERLGGRYQGSGTCVYY